MENKELETWLKETKAKNLSLDELEILIVNYDLTDEGIFYSLNGVTIKEKAAILFNQWHQEAEFSPQRGDKVLVWNDDKSFEFERIFLTEIEGTEEPIYVVAKQSETSFIGGGMFYIETYEHMKPLPTEQPTETDFKTKVIKLIEKRIGICNELIEENKNLNRFKNAALWQDCKGECQEILKQIKQLC